VGIFKIFSVVLVTGKRLYSWYFIMSIAQQIIQNYS
jgi:hypothetical protein